jgi:signal transduction histidine kinase
VERVVLAGLVALRWAAWAWMAFVLAISVHKLLRPWLAVALIAAAFAFTVAATIWVRTAPHLLVRTEVVAVELLLALALVLCDGWAYGAGHAFSTSQSIGSVWPLVAVLSAGVAFGKVAGGVSGALVGAARFGATLANGVRHFAGARTVSLASTTVFYVVAGVVAGYLMSLLNEAEHEIAEARAREDIARTLHDGVLQTLAVVERRSTDADLVRMAHEQDRALRRYLFGDGGPADGPLGLAASLRDAAARFEDRFGLRADVLVPPDLPLLDPAQVEAITGAASEAMTNAGKHARPQAGVGLSRSITQRMAEAGGRAEVRSRPDQGTEVCLWL